MNNALPSPADRRFLTAVSKLLYANPFLPDLIARSLDLFARITPEATLQGAQKYMADLTREQVTGSGRPRS